MQAALEGIRAARRRKFRAVPAAHPHSGGADEAPVVRERFDRHGDLSAGRGKDKVEGVESPTIEPVKRTKFPSRLAESISTKCGTSTTSTARPPDGRMSSGLAHPADARARRRPR